MKKNKTPPDNTGKKYLTELTPKQRKFIDVYCSKYGEITGTACPIAAGYNRDSAHTKASEILDYRKYPQVRTEIALRLAHSRELWSISRDKSMAHLFKIGEEAKKNGRRRRSYRDFKAVEWSSPQKVILVNDYLKVINIESNI